MNHIIDPAYVSIEDYTKMQTKFNEIVEENEETHIPVYEALKIAMLQAQEETERAGIEADFETIDIQMVPVE